MKLVLSVLTLSLILTGCSGMGTGENNLPAARSVTQSEFLRQTQSGLDTTYEVLRIVSSGKYEVLTFKVKANIDIQKTELEEIDIECGDFTNSNPAILKPTSVARPEYTVCLLGGSRCNSLHPIFNQTVNVGWTNANYGAYRIQRVNGVIVGPTLTRCNLN